MRSLSKLTLGLLAGILVGYPFGCSQPQIQSEGTGGSTVSDTGGSEMGGQSGTVESGGQPGSGGFRGIFRHPIRFTVFFDARVIAFLSHDGLLYI